MPNLIHALVLAVAAAAPPSDREMLIEGVDAIASPGVPGPLVVTSLSAFPVVAVDMPEGGRAPVVAAGRMGRGRFVAFGHTGYFGAGDAHDTGRLLGNAVRWAGGERETLRIGSTERKLAAWLGEQDFDAAHLSGVEWIDRLEEFDVVCVGQRALRDDVIPKLHAFIERGGGALVGGLGWGWLQLHPGRTIQEHPGSLLLGRAGVYWADGTIRDVEPLPVSRTPDRFAHAQAALAAFNPLVPGAAPRGERAAMSLAAPTVLRVLRTVPDDEDTLRPLVEAVLGPYRGKVIPTKAVPVRAASIKGVALAADAHDAKTADPEDLVAHPSADVFPGLVPDFADRVGVTLVLDTTRPGWRGTGLYAVAGEPLRVSVPPVAADAGLALRLGCHKDLLYGKPRWSRAPEITRVYELDAPQITAASAFGGLVYLVVPEDCAVESVELTIDGVVTAPRYVLGRTSVGDWRQARASPAPWAELETDKVVLTVPSRAVRGLDDPEPLLRFWDEVLDAAATLAARPLERERPERYVADVQISAGYMHAGYPIMTHLDAAARMVDVEALRGGAWGLFHELGHNHQHRDWTFAGTGEVTCNLFALYIHDRLCNRLAPDDRGHRGATEDVGVDQYLADGAPFSRWKSKPFLALRMYIQLQDAFGWEPFELVFAEYRDLPESERPRNDNEKRDQWLVRMSRTTGRNLGPFFTAWGVPTSDAARASVADLPEWMPAG